MRFAGPTFGLLALLAHVGVQAAPLEGRSPFPHARDVSLYNKRGGNEEVLIINQIIAIQQKNQGKDKKKDDKRIDAYKKKNKNKNTEIVVINVIEIRNDDNKNDKNKKNKNKAEKDKAAKEKADKEKADKAKADKEKADKAKADKEKADKEKADKDKAVKNKAIKGNVTAAAADQNATATHCATPSATQPAGIVRRGIVGNNSTANGVTTMYAMHTILADNGAAENEKVQIFDYQTTGINQKALVATGLTPIPTGTGASNIMPGNGSPPSLAPVVPDPAKPSVTGL
ncbi:hypothetical protein GP486_007394 [Trichoglossum hirsutum]|uniref:Uncharacterized protein n=1 Tax=Trichoglossum hirsutum TaxID=265104 RepID=A0A9P8II83_9PEZI|nr:hypothetical protein GP486_007394 [Trichoglossum hirsutum]